MPSPLARALVCLGTVAVLLSSKPGWAVSGIQAGEQTWSGDVRVTEDVLVPPGARLNIAAGTRVVFAPSESTKVDPPYWNTETELAVGGTLEVLGTPDKPVTFEGEGKWAGLIAAPGGRVWLKDAVVRGAEEGVLCVGAECRLDRVRIEAGEYGVVLGPGARAAAAGTEVTGCRVGILDGRPEGTALAGVSVRGSRDVELLRVPASARALPPAEASAPSGALVEYVGEYTVEKDETWRGQVFLSGRVTVVPGAVLTLDPGTRVSFRKADTNADGLGEGELLVLGGIRSRGKKGKPVVFQSAEETPGPGDWDKVSVISSEDPDNLFEHTVFRHGTQALHAHFSRVAARSCFFEDNLRAVQFQESEGVSVEDCVFVRNKQALRFRDSKVSVTGSRFLGNLFGVHAFRSELAFSDNLLAGSPLGGFLAKESRVVFEGNRVEASRDGFRSKDPGSSVRIRDNRFEGFAEDALSLALVEGLVEGNRFEGAGLDLASVEDAAVSFRGNHFGAAGRDGLHLKGGRDVDARENYWGEGDPAARVHDRQDDPSLGSVTFAPALKKPPRVKGKE